jgi:uncharacterized protein YqgC (DUF456 family)
MVLPTWALPIALVAMLIGLIGVFLPIVPGVGFIWLVALIYALLERFATIDPATFGVLSALGLIGVTTDIWTSQVGATVGGASWRSMLVGLLGGTIGALVGLLFLGVGAVPGAILGALLGVLLMEWRAGKDWEQASRAAGGWLIGCLLSSVFQAIIAVLMIGIFAWQALRG